MIKYYWPVIWLGELMILFLQGRLGGLMILFLQDHLVSPKDGLLALVNVNLCEPRYVMRKQYRFIDVRTYACS